MIRAVTSTRIAEPGSPGNILSCLREERASSRPELAEYTGMSRTVVSQRVELLMAAGLVVEDGMKASTGRRHAVRLRFADEAGVVLAGHLGATKARLALTDLSGRILSERSTEWPIRVGPVRTLEWLVSEFEQLLDLTGRSRADLKGIGIGVPGPVEHATGRPARLA